jgi:hypothetical protein
MKTQRLATIFDGITRHSPEGLNFKSRAETVGWKQAVRERDEGTYGWTLDRPIDSTEQAIRPSLRQTRLAQGAGQALHDLGRSEQVFPIFGI